MVNNAIKPDASPDAHVAALGLQSTGIETLPVGYQRGAFVSERGFGDCLPMYGRAAGLTHDRSSGLPIADDLGNTVCRATPTTRWRRASVPALRR